LALEKDTDPITMLLRRLQVFLITLLFVTVIYHFLKDKSHYKKSNHLSEPIRFHIPQTIPYQPIYYPVFPIQSILVSDVIIINETKGYKAYKKREARRARRKYNYSYHY
jgi:hypothetical protein